MIPQHFPYLTCLILGLSFSLTGLFAQETSCARKTHFGEAEICLPLIEGYVECYTDPAVRPLADATEVPANRVIAYYLPQEVYQKKDSLGLIEFDNFFKVYGTKQIESFEATPAFLTQMQDILSGSFITKNWDEMEKEIDKIGFEVEVGAPVIVKQYTLNERSFTYITLIQYDFPGKDPYTVAMALNGLLLNDRIVWMAYYLDYKGEETLSQVQTISNKIVNKILSVHE